MQLARDTLSSIRLVSRTRTRIARRVSRSPGVPVDARRVWRREQLARSLAKLIDLHLQRRSLGRVLYLIEEVTPLAHPLNVPLSHIRVTLRRRLMPIAIKSWFGRCTTKCSDNNSNQKNNIECRQRNQVLLRPPCCDRPPTVQAAGSRERRRLKRLVDSVPGAPPPPGTPSVRTPPGIHTSRNSRRSAVQHHAPNRDPLHPRSSAGGTSCPPPPPPPPPACIQISGPARQAPHAPIRPIRQEHRASYNSASAASLQAGRAHSSRPNHFERSGELDGGRGGDALLPHQPMVQVLGYVVALQGSAVHGQKLLRGVRPRRQENVPHACAVLPGAKWQPQSVGQERGVTPVHLLHRSASQMHSGHCIRSVLGKLISSTRSTLNFKV